MQNPEILKWVRILLIIFAIFLCVKSFGAIKDLRGNHDPVYNSISVFGEGEVVAVPDIATFTFTVSKDGVTANEAQTAVADKMNNILAEIKKENVDEKDIKTTDYSLTPKYKYEEVGRYYGNQVADGYTASHSVMIKIRDTKNAGKLITIVGDLGATSVSSLSFTVDEQDALVEQARAEAIKNAREKAAILSKQLGVKLVRITSYYDNSGYASYDYGYGRGGGSDIKISAVPTVANIPQGENKFKITVNVSYEIR